MSTITFKAAIHCDAYEDDYKEGELNQVNSWAEELTAPTVDELRQKVLDATYQKDFTTIDDEQMNEYEWCTEYHTSYLANAENQGEATPNEVEAWKQGNLKLYAINCHILVTKLTETKASL